MILVILPPRSDVYNAVKTRLTCEDGLPSQFLVHNPKNLSLPRAQSVAFKVAVQMLTKVGSTPWSIFIPAKPTMMIVGIDVFHHKTRPSVLGFVATMTQNTQDRKLTR